MSNSGFQHSTMQSTAARRMAEEQERLNEAIGPNWRAWPIGTYDRRTLWSAMPVGAAGAVITDMTSADALTEAVRAYEADLPRHLADARADAAACPGTGVGRDRKRVLEALEIALEALALALKPPENARAQAD